MCQTLHVDLSLFSIIKSIENIRVELIQITNLLNIIKVTTKQIMSF